MSQKSYLQIMFKEIGIDDNFEVYSESIKSIHQYGGCDFYIKKCVPTDKIMVSFIQYPEINLNYPVSTNEWMSNQWLFRNESGAYNKGDCIIYDDFTLDSDFDLNLDDALSDGEEASADDLDNLENLDYSDIESDDAAEC